MRKFLELVSKYTSDAALLDLAKKADAGDHYGMFSCALSGGYSDEAAVLRLAAKMADFIVQDIDEHGEEHILGLYDGKDAEYFKEMQQDFLHRFGQEQSPSALALAVRDMVEAATPRELLLRIKHKLPKIIEESDGIELGKIVDEFVNLPDDLVKGLTTRFFVCDVVAFCARALEHNKMTALRLVVEAVLCSRQESPQVKRFREYVQHPDAHGIALASFHVAESEDDAELGFRVREALVPRLKRIRDKRVVLAFARIACLKSDFESLAEALGRALELGATGHEIRADRVLVNFLDHPLVAPLIVALLESD